MSPESVNIRFLEAKAKMDHVESLLCRVSEQNQLILLDSGGSSQTWGIQLNGDGLEREEFRLLGKKVVKSLTDARYISEEWRYNTWHRINEILKNTFDHGEKKATLAISETREKGEFLYREPWQGILRGKMNSLGFQGTLDDEMVRKLLISSKAGNGVNSGFGMYQILGLIHGDIVLFDSEREIYWKDEKFISQDCPGATGGPFYVGAKAL